MEKYDPRVDAYIGKSAEFAKPVLNYIRKLVHQTSDQILETMKWGFPHFEYKGSVCFMSSFKEHCAFGFRKSSLLSDPSNSFKNEFSEAMGQFGRIKSIADLPGDEVIAEHIREAIELNKNGIKVEKKKDSTGLVQIPGFFADALNKNVEAKANFEKFNNSHRKEYIRWIEDAKTDLTRSKRIATAMQWIAEGKGKNWKYERKR